MLLTTLDLVPFIFLNQGSSIPFLITGLVIFLFFSISCFGGTFASMVRGKTHCF